MPSVITTRKADAIKIRYQREVKVVVIALPPNYGHAPHKIKNRRVFSHTQFQRPTPDSAPHSLLSLIQFYLFVYLVFFLNAQSVLPATELRMDIRAAPEIIPYLYNILRVSILYSVSKIFTFLACWPLPSSVICNRISCLSVK